MGQDKTFRSQGQEGDAFDFAASWSFSKFWPDAPRRRRPLAANDLDDQQFLSWILDGGGVYLDEPAQPDRPMPEMLDAILSELGTLRAELTNLKRQPMVAASYRSKAKPFVCVEGDDAE